MDLQQAKANTTVIEPSKGWQLVNFNELWEYRDLLYFLVWRDIRVQYAQTVLGFGWAILEPLIQIVVFTIIFGSIAKIETDGIPYFLFSTVAIVPWTYMSAAMTNSSQSLVSGQGMLGKVYFPRLIFPIAPVLTKLVDFFIALAIIAVVMLFYGVKPTEQLLLLPVFIIMMIVVPTTVGFWLAALSVQYRDVKFAMQFIIRMLIYTAPIVYSASAIPDGWRFVYSLNPIVSVVEGFRACVLGTPVPWAFVLPGMVVGVVLFITGALYFRRMERLVVDVI